MSIRKRQRVERCAIAYRCPACFAPMLLEFRKPKYSEPRKVFKKCVAIDGDLKDQGCGSKFRLTIMRSAITDEHGKELPMKIIQKKVLALTDTGYKAFKAKSTHPLDNM